MAVPKSYQGPKMKNTKLCTREYRARRAFIAICFFGSGGGGGGRSLIHSILSDDASKRLKDFRGHLTQVERSRDERGPSARMTHTK